VTVGTERDARRALLGGLIDHAPLFPPASLPLDEALEDHRRALASPRSWMVNRFVCPASRLAELEGEELRLSVVVDVPVEELDARVEAVEGREIGLTRLGRETYVEVPPEAGLEQLKAAGARAKVRCGPEPPPVDVLAGFVRRCRDEGVVFKATAGLHHALPTDGQHGFLNLLAAAVFGDEEQALADNDPEAFRLASAFSWRDRSAGAEEVAEVRRALFASVGSCSFTEPVDELKALGLV
jgi:hypothetical protein